MMYLDTHVVVWLYAGHLNKFSTKTLELMENNALFISPMVELELDFLFNKKRINADSETILDNLYSRIGLEVCPLAFSSVVRRAKKNAWTFDPFDRLIAAQAQLGDSLLITKDKVIRQHYTQAEWS